MLCNFSVRMLKYFLENSKKNFAHKKLKRTPQKVAYLWQLEVFFLCSHDCPKQPRLEYPFYIQLFFYDLITTFSTFCMLSKLPIPFSFVLYSNSSFKKQISYYLLSHCTVQRIEKEAITA